MAQVLLYGLEIVPGPEGSDGEAVAQVMQAGLREADRGHKALVEMEIMCQQGGSID